MGEISWLDKYQMSILGKDKFLAIMDFCEIFGYKKEKLS